jgi:hypothetical protein
MRPGDGSLLVMISLISVATAYVQNETKSFLLSRDGM